MVAAVVLWLIFTVVRKLFVLALLVALAVGAWMIWEQSLWDWGGIAAVSD